MHELSQPILNCLESYCPKNLLVSIKQYGVLKGRSTEVVVLNMAERIRMNMENRTLTMGIFSDLNNTFDLINHSISLDKLFPYGIRRVLLELRRF